jgi:hypothetical protein
MAEGLAESPPAQAVRGAVSKLVGMARGQQVSGGTADLVQVVMRLRMP